MTIDKILILDFGSQTTQLIARRVRESGVYCEIHPYNISKDAIFEFEPQGIILSGGPATTTDQDGPRVSDYVIDYGVPILGICYGMQTLCQSLGGKVSKSQKQEFGRAKLTITNDTELFAGVWSKYASTPTVWMSHGDRIENLPDGFEVTAIGAHEGIAAVQSSTGLHYGVLFHPEVVHTTDGAAILRNFTHRICYCHGDWTMSRFRYEAVHRIREQVGDKRVICGLSGGVDSTVTATLIHEAIGDQLQCVFIDNGLLRQDEAHEVTEMYREKLGLPLTFVQGDYIFMQRLRGVTDPEQKRKIIGNTFIDLFDGEADTSRAEFLAQGTLYPDVIESVSPHGGPSAVIKSHHNVGGLPEHMKLKLIEPLRELFKDEVRTLGRELGLPDEFVKRHPFPGPGLAIRVLGEVTYRRLAILRKADAIYLEEIRRAGLYDDIWQAFAVLLPVQSVGVMGDARTYENACVLRAVTATDGMTAAVYRFSDDFLDHVSTRIINEVRGINRVVYDRTSKPPGTIEWE